jgi:uncharacterized membrane protein
VLGPGLVLGAGLGGFVDGIVLHQIMQWHHLLSARSGDITANTLADGLFHAASWVLVVAGVGWLWARVGRRPGPWRRSALIGPVLAGWGVFNLVEGVVNHHLLGLHHVRQGPGQLAYDLGFLALGAALVGVGALLYRRTAR